MSRTAARLAERAARMLGVAALALAFALAVSRALRPGPANARAAAVALRFDPSRDDSASGVADAAASVVARSIADGIVRDAGRAGGTTWPVVTARLSAVPSADERATLGAAFDAGLSVQWQDSVHLRALALDAGAAASPNGGTVITATASGSRPTDRVAMSLRDAGGVLDSLEGRAPSLRLRAASVQTPLRAELRRDGRRIASARAATPVALTVRHVRLYALPGWESKFVSAALEESGWMVDGTLALAPRALVRLGSPAVLDTARYSAVVVLDSGVATVPELRRFVAQGGGLVIAGDALRDVALSSIGVARIAGDRAPIAGALLTDDARRGLAAFHLVAGPTSMTLEREGDDAVVVVARQRVGRVLASGYRGTWHWRMEGRDESADAHRRWWSDLVGAVAFASAPDDSASAASASAASASRWPGDAAPVADLVARLGPASAADTPPTLRETGAWPPLRLLFVVAVVALLVEWALRRLRGAP